MTVAIILGVIIVGILVYASTKADTINIQRSEEIKAPPSLVYPFINDLHNWPAWSERDIAESTIQRTFSGTASGKGAISEWVGTGKAGKGRMEITESIAPSRIIVKVDFEKPFLAHNINEFTLEPHDEMTTVTWTWHGTSPYVLKVMSVFLNVDRFMGKHFETGLRSLKLLSEK
jgi:hypothetical protein